MPGEVEQLIEHFAEYYNNRRFHKSPDNLTPADVYYGRKKECLSTRKMIEQKTLEARRVYNLWKRRGKKQLQLLRSTP